MAVYSVSLPEKQPFSYCELKAYYIALNGLAKNIPETCIGILGFCALNKM